MQIQYGHGEYAIIFKAMGDETRLKILSMLTRGQTCACKILEAFNFTQPTLSYHMRQLTDSGLVEAEKRGKWVHYSICKERVDLIAEFINAVSKIDVCKGENC
ncbi:MAG: metalloregulator ArsR/SmtB family transcription factor [Firmicutes bacterium]|nr:metalloregulator ArsR/SmtB family transcription factor [Bacillota bacterium]